MNASSPLLAVPSDPSSLIPPSSVLNPLNGFSINSTLGVLFIGNILVAILFALTSAQIYIYYQRNKDDRAFLRHLIFFLWIIDAVHLAFVSHTVYNYAITNFMNPLAMVRVSWSLAADMTVGGLNDIIVTFVFVHRIWRFGGQRRIVKAVVAAITLGSFAIMAGDVAITTLALSGEGTYIAFSEKYSWLWYATFGARAVVDVLIASTIYFMLRKSRENAKKTKSVIRLIILYSINTCALTTVCVVFSVITYAVFPNTFIAFALSMLLPKLMLNSLLAILNSRQTMRRMVDRSKMHGISLSHVTAANSDYTHGETEGDKKHMLSVRVDTTTEHAWDGSVVPTLASEV